VNLNHLTPRQVAILELMACGYTDRQIGKVLFISPKTVKTHGQQLRAALRAHNRAEAVAIGYRRGILSLPELEAADGF
jgi:DNA-binding NarL/FixJ family response regulator